MYIYNSQPFNKKAVYILNKAIESVQAENLLEKSLEVSKNSIKIKDEIFNIADRRVFIIAFGKSAWPMAIFFENKLKNKISAGVAIGIRTKAKPKNILAIEGGHPQPTKMSEKGAKEILKLKSKYKITKKDLIVCLISGGGSALLALPSDEVSLKEKQKINDLLIKSGATISEINCVRKHISKIKGGRLAKHYEENEILSLIISDVINDPLDVISSGPTYFDPSTFYQAKKVLEKYNIWDIAPKSIKKILKKGIKKKIAETPKKLPKNTHNFLIGNNKVAVESLSNNLKKEKVKIKKIQKPLQKDVKLEAENIFKEIKKEIKNNSQNKIAVIFGGEPTVNIKKAKGKGGRNQELISWILKFIQKENKNESKNIFKKNWILSSCGTDGSDYVQDVAGGIINQNSLKILTLKNTNIDKFLNKHDSYHLLKNINGLLKTKTPTGANVGDIGIFLYFN